MRTSPPVGSSATIAVTGRDGTVTAYVGTVIANRYPHLYVALDIGTTVLNIPVDRIVKTVITSS